MRGDGIPCQRDEVGREVDQAEVVVAGELDAAYRGCIGRGGEFWLSHDELGLCDDAVRVLRDGEHDQRDVYLLRTCYL